MLLLNTRSTLPIVTTSPSVRIADPTRMPLTNVPLMLRSRIWVPSGVDVKVACSREARTSGMTMSLSSGAADRDGAGGAGRGDGRGVPDVRCERNFTNLVARFDTSPGLASMTVNSAGGSCSEAADHSVDGRSVLGAAGRWAAVTKAAAAVPGGDRRWGVTAVLMGMRRRWWPRRLGWCAVRARCAHERRRGVWSPLVCSRAGARAR